MKLPNLLNGLLGMIAAQSSLMAAPNTWTGVTDNQWNTTTANWTAPTIWTNSLVGTPQHAIFGAAGAGAISIASGVQTQSVTINSNGYSFIGGPLAITMSTGDTGASPTTIALANNVSFTLNSAYQYIGTAQPFGTHAFALGAGSALTVNGGGTFNAGTANFQWNIGASAAAQTATLNINGGAYSGISNVQTTGIVNHNAATVTATGDLVIGANGSSAYNVSHASAVLAIPGQNVFSGGQIRIGSQAGTAPDRKEVRLNISNGSVTALNRAIVGNADFTDARLNVSGGSLTITTPVGSATASTSGIYLLKQTGTSAQQTAEINLSGTGTITTSFISFGGDSGSSTNSTAALNVTGGTLYLGSGTANGGTLANAIRIGAAAPTTSSINLGGGTVGAVQNWNSAVDINLTGTNGNVTFRAQDSGSNNRDIALSGVLSGSGGLIKTGGGSLTLSGNSTYTGNTIINGGNLILADSGALTFAIGASGVNNAILGTGSIVLNGSFMFDLTNAAEVGTWQIVDVENLTESYGGTFSVDGWATAGDGIWTHDNYSFNQTTGTLSAIPEPSAWLMGVSGIGLMCLFRRRSERSPR